ncbi:MAG: glycerol-3-phosphate acyltransferase [Bianqueaceae bacterium]
MERILCIIIGYALGCIQTAYIIGKLYKKIDIRDYGSGNAGATNAMRVLGMRIGVLTLAVDALKAILAVVVTALIFGYDNKYLLLYAGIGVVLGHNYPFYMKFKGGKGVAATLGIVAAVDFRLLLLAGIPALLLLLTLKYMSVASLTFVLLLPL